MNHLLKKGKNMKIPMDILRISAGKIEDGGMLYASAFVLDETVNHTLEPDRIDVGKQYAKVRMSTDNENALAKRLASTGLVPCILMCEVETSVRKNEISMRIVNFDVPKQQA